MWPAIIDHLQGAWGFGGIAQFSGGKGEGHSSLTEQKGEREEKRFYRGG